MKVAILGYGKSGQAAEKLLINKGITDISIFDDNEELDFLSISVFVSYNDYDVTVVSPGIDLSRYGLSLDMIKNCTSELDLAYGSMDKSKKIITVTGTNGKSTTTSLVTQILNLLGVKAVACGNIGLPFGEAVFDKSIDVFVVELSSFQIDLLRNFHIDSGAILNLSADHIDRYGSVDEYYLSKFSMLKFLSQVAKLTVLDDENIKNQLEDENVKSKLEDKSIDYVYVDKKFEKYPILKDNILDFGSYQFDIGSYKLFGDHNLLNLSFALLLASSVIRISGDITEQVSQLTGLKHRSEIIGEFKGVTYINDSKATNVDSVMVALESLNKPSTLLIGGRDKLSDYKPLANLINSNVSKVFYFGEAADIISDQLSPMLNDIDGRAFLTLSDAVKYAVKDAVVGESVILSPACTSFDEFKNYAARGDKFKEYVLKYVEELDD